MGKMGRRLEHMDREKLKEKRAKKEKKCEEEAMVGRLSDGDAVDDVVTVLSRSNLHTLISGTGEKVPISYLRGKAVGLYFYNHWTSARVVFELKHIYKKVREMGEDFELVFICLQSEWPDEGFEFGLLRSCQQADENRFNKYFLGNTWLASPFSQTTSNRTLYEWANSLKDAEPLSELVIIRPGENNIALTRALGIYYDYGIDAYPFSKSRATEIEVARFKSLTLDEVLFSGADESDEKFVYDQGGQKISASHLVGKRILLFLTRPHTEDSLCGDEELMYEKVIEWCTDRKLHDKAFEMLRVFYLDKYDDLPVDPTLEEASKRYNKDMSWLEFPHDKYDMKALYSKLLKAFGDTYLYVPMCVAFGQDGRFITMKRLSSRFAGRNTVAYDHLDLFEADNLYARVRNYIADIKGWVIEDEET